MAIRKLRESNNLSKLEICNILVDFGFGNEEEGYLDYFLDNPKYCASVNLDDMGAYVDDYDKGEQVELPYANGATRKILRTKEDVDEFLDFIADLENERYLESKARKTGNKRSIKEDLDWDSDQARCLRNVNAFKGYCSKIIDHASKLEPMYDEIENYLTYTPLNDYYLDKIGKVIKDTLDIWSKIDRAEFEAKSILKELEKAGKKYPKNQ